MRDIDRSDPPTTGDELAVLTGFLDFHRDTLRIRCEGLSTEQLHTTHPPSTLTLARLLAHAAFVEDYWFGVMLRGREPATPFDVADWEADDDWEMSWSVGKGVEELRTVLDDVVERSRVDVAAVVAGGGMDATTKGTQRDGTAFSLRWVLVHMIEEYCRHNGHADLIRESIDGTVGE